MKMARRQGATKENIRSDLWLRSNVGAGPFPSQPYGPWEFWRFSALLARARSLRIWPLTRALKNARIPRGKPMC